MQHSAARVTKQAINSLILEAADKYLGTGHFHLGFPLML
jgi:hypothetical protein